VPAFTFGEALRHGRGFAAAACCNRLQIRTRAERAAGAGKNGDGYAVIGAKCSEGVEESLRRCGIDSAAPSRPIDRDNARGPSLRISLMALASSATVAAAAIRRDLTYRQPWQGGGKGSVASTAAKIMLFIIVALTRRSLAA
jgi:hypothetical protein